MPFSRIASRRRIASLSDRAPTLNVETTPRGVTRSDATAVAAPRSHALRRRRTARAEGQRLARRPQREDAGREVARHARAANPTDALQRSPPSPAASLLGWSLQWGQAWLHRRGFAVEGRPLGALTSASAPVSAWPPTSSSNERELSETRPARAVRTARPRPGSVRRFRAPSRTCRASSRRAFSGGSPRCTRSFRLG